MLENYTYRDLGLQNIDLIASADKIFQPQPGGQTIFMSHPATVRFYGGAAGSGKTYAELLDPLRWISNPFFNALILRRIEDDVKVTGGLWDESKNIYPFANAKPTNDLLRWSFPSGAKIDFAGIGKSLREEDLERWKGSQVCGLYFDEGTECTVKQFRYLLSRNRSSCGIKPYACVTCNPVPGSWVHEFVKWYLDRDGYPDKSKRGYTRYFATLGENFVFGDSPESICSQYDTLTKSDCTSYTFIYATLDDNPALLEGTPNYATNLKNSGGVNALKLLKGNWTAVPVGKIFQADNFRAYAITPAVLDYIIITVDTASKTATRNDYSVAQCWGKSGKGIYLLDQFRGKFTITPLYNGVKAFVSACKNKFDAPFLGLKIEDASAGTQLIQLFRDDGIPVQSITRRKDKYTRALECQIYVEGGYVFIDNSADYYAEFIAEVVRFSAVSDNKEGYHDDQVDCMLDAIDFMLINGNNVNPNVYENQISEFVPTYCV